jgi:hypothetical protein
MMLIRNNKELTEKQQNDAMAKLMCHPEKCPLKCRHPPNGLEFGLGCGMCKDEKKSSSSSSAADYEVIGAVPAAGPAPLIMETTAVRRWSRLAVVGPDSLDDGDRKEDHAEVKEDTAMPSFSVDYQQASVIMDVGKPPVKASTWYYELVIPMSKMNAC